MKTPFPGMDPFLESPAYWRDFHHTFLTYWSDWLLDHLPDHYEVRINDRPGAIIDDGGTPRMPDLRPAEVPGEVAVLTLEREAEPMDLDYIEQERDSFIRIYHRHDASVIAVLELLSPTNKYGDGRNSYLEKRNELIRDTVHIVELDLLLGGKRMPVKGKWPAGNYFALVGRGDQRPRCEVYPWHLPERLTRIRLPLKAPDPDLIFDLPGLYELTYQRGRYTRSLPYNDPPPVPLPDDYLRWINERLTEWRKPT